jgi:hypothetical protein
VARTLGSEEHVKQNEAVNTVITLTVLAGLAWALYRPRIQQSSRYQALVVPLANIMDVGFIVLSPIIVGLVGYAAPLFMLAICLLAIAMGFVIAFNIRNFVPVESTATGALSFLSGASSWSLAGASVVNIAYYAQVLMTLILLPLSLYSAGTTTTTSAILLGILAAYGVLFGLSKLNSIGDKMTAFSLAAITAVVVAFIVFNIQEALGGRFDFPSYSPVVDADTLRQLLGFFAIVQGFEASRYLGKRFSADEKISTMRLAQYIASVTFVVFLASILILFVDVKPKLNQSAVFEVADAVIPVLPFILIAAAVASEFSAITNAVVSRSDLLVEASRGRLPRRATFPLLLAPAILITLLTDVQAAVALASRVFALYYFLQSAIAVLLAFRERAWGKVAAFSAIGVAMAVIMVFGIPS